MTVPVNPVYALLMAFLIFFGFLNFFCLLCLYLIACFYIKLILEHVEHKLTDITQTRWRLIREQYMERDLHVDVDNSSRVNDFGELHDFYFFPPSAKQTVDSLYFH